MDSLQTFVQAYNLAGMGMIYATLFWILCITGHKYTKIMMKIRKLGCFLHMANVTPSFFGEVGVTLAMVKYQFLLMTMITDGSHIG